MESLLKNPVYYALATGDRLLAEGDAHVKYFPAEVSPFAGFEEGLTDGFERLHALLPAGRSILFARPEPLTQVPGGWLIKHHIPGLQFIHRQLQSYRPQAEIRTLHQAHILEMIALTRLTRPGPFGTRTIEFGSYGGIFEKGKIAAMAGERLHIENFSEISAVCTHPEYLGKGYATDLLQYLIQHLLSKGKTPFLHVRADNERAIAVYQRLGFAKSRLMQFYFMELT